VKRISQTRLVLTANNEKRAMSYGRLVTNGNVSQPLVRKPAHTAHSMTYAY